MSNYKYNGYNFSSVPAMVNKLMMDVYGANPYDINFWRQYEFAKPVQDMLKEAGITPEEFNEAIDELQEQINVLSNRIDSLPSALVYKGEWNLVANEPELVDNDPSKAGFMYRCVDPEGEVDDQPGWFDIWWTSGDFLVYTNDGVIEHWDFDISDYFSNFMTKKHTQYVRLYGTAENYQSPEQIYEAVTVVNETSNYTSADKMLGQSEIQKWVNKRVMRRYNTNTNIFIAGDPFEGIFMLELKSSNSDSVTNRVYYQLAYGEDKFGIRRVYTQSNGVASYKGWTIYQSNSTTNWSATLNISVSASSIGDYMNKKIMVSPKSAAQTGNPWDDVISIETWGSQATNNTTEQRGYQIATLLDGNMYIRPISYLYYSNSLTYQNVITYPWKHINPTYPVTPSAISYKKVDIAGDLGSGTFEPGESFSHSNVAYIKVTTDSPEPITGGLGFNSYIKDDYTIEFGSGDATFKVNIQFTPYSNVQFNYIQESGTDSAFRIKAVLYVITED